MTKPKSNEWLPQNVEILYFSDMIAEVSIKLICNLENSVNGKLLNHF